MLENKDFWVKMEALGDWMKLPKGYVLIPERTKLLMETCQKLQSLLEDESDNCVVEVRSCPLGFGDAVVSFETDDFVVRDMRKFSNAIQYLNNFEIYSIGKGTIRFDGIFSKVAMVTPLTDIKG